MSDLKKALKKSADTIAPVIEDQTILKISIPSPKEGDDKVYTYVALYVNNLWYMSGYGSLLSQSYATTLDLFRAISACKGSKVSIVTSFETIR